MSDNEHPGSEEEAEDNFGDLVQRYRRPRGRTGNDSGDASTLAMGLARRYSQIINIPTPNSVYTPWDEGAMVSMLLIPTQIIVIPGLVFPLRFRDDQNTGLHFAMLRSLLDSDEPNVFGAVHMPNEDDFLEQTWWDCGVTVQVLDVTEENQSKLELKCMGRQRFNVVSEELTSRHMRASVKILEDQKQPRLLDPSGRVKDAFKRGSLPVWQHKLRDVFSLQDLIKKEIRMGCPGVDADNAPSEPIMFSFWLITTMPFNFLKRNKMLREDNLIVRLREQLAHVQKLNLYDYCCAACGAACSVVSCKDLMSSAQAGPFYHIKPEGMLDETVLCTTVNSETTYAYGTPSARNSVNGYGRQLLGCKTCMTDLGWKFTAFSEDLSPRSFYGLKRRLLFIQSQTLDDSDSD